MSILGVGCSNDRYEKELNDLAMERAVPLLWCCLKIIGALRARLISSLAYAWEKAKEKPIIDEQTADTAKLCPDKVENHREQK